MKKEIWPDGVIVVDESCKVEGDEPGRYWVWQKDNPDDNYPDLLYKSCSGPDSVFMPGNIYVKADVPKRPQPRVELGDGIYRVRLDSGAIVYREKRGDGSYRLDGVLIGVWGGYTVLSKIVEEPIE